MPDDEDDWEFETAEVATGEAPVDTDETDDEDDDQWRYSLSDLEDGDDDADEQSAVDGNVFGSLSSDTEVIEPGSPSLENTLFVVAGALLALVFFLQFYFLMG